MSEVDCEVVVIGAGASGLNAARLLVEAGRDVIVLEATDRVGGRTLSRALNSGSMIDLGGQWVGPTQTRVVALAKALNLATFKTYDSGDNIVPANGELVRVSGAFALDPAADADIRQARLTLEALSHAIPLERPWMYPQALELDQMSFAAWIDQNLSTERGRWQFRFMAPAVFSVEAHELSMLHVAFYFGSAGGVERLTATESGGQDSRFVDGMQQLSLSLARSLGDRVRLRNPVRRIAQATTGVAVASEGLVVTGRRAIVAMAPALAGRLAYQPPMPPLRDGLTQRAPMGTAIKMMLVFDTPFWRDAGLSGFARTLSDVPQLLYDNSPADLSCGVLLGFTEGAAARRWIEADASARQAAAIATAVACFGEGAATPTEYIEHAWMEEEFARGCYAGTMPPGVWTSFGPALREPVGRIHWAGTETATSWNGYVEGALQAGERAAAEVLIALTNP